MVPRENESYAYAKMGRGGANIEYYGIFRSGLILASGFHINNNG